MPRAVPVALALALHRWEVVLREAVVVGLVGAGGLGYLLVRQVAAFDAAGAAATVLALAALTLLVDVGSAALRRAVR